MNCRKGVRVRRQPPPPGRKPTANDFLENSLPCSRVRLERQSRAPGEGSLLPKPLSCVPLRNNVFELAAGQRQVLEGATFTGVPALIRAAAPPPRLLPFSSLFHRLAETFSLSLSLSLFPLARLCFSAPVPPLLIAPYLPLSVLVSPFRFSSRVRLWNLRAFQPQTF